MKSLSALKRTVQVGTSIEVVKHYQPKLAGTKRVATKIQTNGYYFEHEGKRMWAAWPNASDLEIHADDSYTINFGEPGTNNRLATFRLISNG